jgi:CTD kinase subunit alpha
VSLTIGGGASWLIALRNVSCIMLELFVRKPVFQGNDEIHQLEAIYEIMGTPTEEEWPGLASMPWYELVKPKEVLPSRFDEYFSK